jgi:hypothetical protein
MPGSKKFRSLSIDVDLKNATFRVLGTEDQSGSAYQGLGANGFNGKLLEEVFAKTASAYPTASLVSLYVNDETKRILQDPNWKKP